MIKRVNIIAEVQLYFDQGQIINNLVRLHFEQLKKVNFYTINSHFVETSTYSD